MMFGCSRALNTAICMYKFIKHGCVILLLSQLRTPIKPHIVISQYTQLTLIFTDFVHADDQHAKFINISRLIVMLKNLANQASLRMHIKMAHYSKLHLL